MSSKSVWIWLPGETEPTLAGQFVLDDRTSKPLGPFQYGF